MLRFLAGLILLFSLPISAFGQAKGEVESIGFGSLYRPNAWVPMLVRLSADKSGTYQIRVVQNDLDSDHEVFKQDISLTGSEDGKISEQKFWMYFIPQPTNGGLPQPSDGLRALQQELKVFLCDEKGRELIPLPVTQTITSIDNIVAGLSSAPRGVKLVLAVSDGAQQPVWHDYQASIGTVEDVIFIPIRSMDMPEDVRGYQMVDDIVWLAAPLPDPSKPSDERRYHAIQSWVRGGGHLVVCQPAQRDATAPVADMLPVEVKEIAPKQDLEPLKTLATAKLNAIREKNRKAEQEGDAMITGRSSLRDDWTLPQGPFMFARAELKPGAHSVLDLAWNADGSDHSPYIARMGYGLGCVTWVAHDLSDPTIVARAKSGWPYVWDKVLDFNHDLLIVDNQTDENTRRAYTSNGSNDIGKALLPALELKSRTNALISIAVVFFIAYWIIAGPGVYFYLLTKVRSQLSWFLFAASAVIATLLTVLVVKLVVRGAPDLHHITIVRGVGNEPTESISQFGLYIPRDGDQQMALPEVSPKHVSYLAAYPEHPSHGAGDVEFPAQLPYLVPIHDSNEDTPVTLTVPYRSTLKKFEARRIGPAGGPIGGAGKITIVDDVQRLEGKLTNGTGEKLHNCYFAFHSPGDNDDDVIMFLPTWDKSQTVDLAELYDLKATKRLKFDSGDQSQFTGTPETGDRIRDVMGKVGSNHGWSEYWYRQCRSSMGGAPYLDDLDKPVPASLIMMSVFERLPAMRKMPNGGDPVELLRRGGRYLDVSHALAAGNMVIIAQGEKDAPLPFPFEVDGDKVAGKGVVLYQWAVSMDRPNVATTRPATQVVEELPADNGGFDPANYNGPMNQLTPQQRQQVLRARQQQMLRQQQQRQRQRQQPQPKPAPPPQSSAQPVAPSNRATTYASSEVATWQQ